MQLLSNIETTEKIINKIFLKNLVFAHSTTGLTVYDMIFVLITVYAPHLLCSIVQVDIRPQRVSEDLVKPDELLVEAVELAQQV